MWNINESDLEFNPDDVLGGGGFGVVYRGRWLGFLDVAVKTARLDKNYDRKAFNNEATLWYNLISPHVINLYGIYQHHNTFAFISPILENGNAAEYLQPFKSDESAYRKEVLWILLDVAKGMCDLHRYGVVHADLKPGNILINKSKRALLGDFGSSKFVLAPLTNATGDRIGTARYMSPERLREEGTTEADDVYAFSMVMYALWTQRQPFFELSERKFNALLEEICYPPHRRPELPSECDMPEFLESLMGRCWDAVAVNRPPFTEIVKILSSHISPRSVETDTVIDFGSQDWTGGYVELFLQAESFRKGTGCTQDLDKASLLYARTAEYGHAQSQYQLFIFYTNGLGQLPRDLVSAFNWCKKAAIQGLVDAQVDLGVCFRYGHGTDVDLYEALLWWQEAANQGCAKGHFNVGVCYHMGIGVPKDLTVAVEWYRKAANLGDAKAQVNLGICYQHGEGVEMDVTEAARLYHEAAIQGNPAAQFNLGYCYSIGMGVVKDLAEAVVWYKRAAAEGYGDAQVNLGCCYRRGEGAKQNFAKSLEWTRRAADQGNAVGQSNLAAAYQNGWGVRKNLAEAAKWYTKAAEQGNADAQNSLAIYYYKGWGVEQCPEHAISWAWKSADQGNGDALANLAFAYENGFGVPKDLDQAILLYSKAADHQIEFALGKCFENGWGVEKDFAAAFRAYSRAGKQGHEVAQMKIGSFYELGNVEKPDAVKAAIWYRKSADQGNIEAEAALRISLRSSAARDLHEAPMWYREALHLGITDVLELNYLVFTYVSLKINPSA
ncbi:hypothetical protein HDU93_001444 [Gonapodya sp. JEL0774]|nr:hypothetical protein HDU93_001444 [Gonapodya sp. JEL0774]